MARYAERDCSDCGKIVSANELIPWREKQLSGTTSRSGFRTGVRGGVGFSSGGSQRFRHVNLRLCTDCAGYRIEAARRARFLATVRAFIFVGVIVAILLALVNIKPSLPAVDNGSDVSDNVTTGIDAAPENRAASPSASASANEGGSGSAGEGSQPPTALQNEPKAEKREVDSGAPPSSDHDTNIVSPAPDRIRSATAAAIRDALESGASKRWSADGKSGYAVPSGAQAYTDRVCRNVYTTIIEHGTQVQSEPQQWCQPNSGGEWTPSS